MRNTESILDIIIVVGSTGRKELVPHSSSRKDAIYNLDTAFSVSECSSIPVLSFSKDEELRPTQQQQSQDWKIKLSLYLSCLPAEENINMRKWKRSCQFPHTPHPYLRQSFILILLQLIYPSVMIKTQPQTPSSRKPSASNQILCNVTATKSHDSDCAISSTPLAGIRAPVPGGKYFQSSPSLSEDSVVNQQHRELQLLIAELKDQDKELNNMSEAHKKQLIGWEKDRQRILALEERSAKLEKELHKKKEIIQTLTQRVKITESQKQELLDKEQKANNQCQILQDKDMIEATEHIVNMTTEIQRLDAMLNESRKRETDIKMEAQKYKQQLRELRHEMKSLKEDVVEKTSENSRQREDIIRLKQENQLLRNELSLLGEREQRKNELLNLAKSKQDRTDSELQCLRQVCENQQNDLELLYLSLNSQAGLQKLEAWGRSLRKVNRILGISQQLAFSTWMHLTFVKQKGQMRNFGLGPEHS
ncbi:CCD62 protein, partial [Polypterus senegalus]